MCILAGITKELWSSRKKTLYTPTLGSLLLFWKTERLCCHGESSVPLLLQLLHLHIRAFICIKGKHQLTKEIKISAECAPDSVNKKEITNISWADLDLRGRGILDAEGLAPAPLLARLIKQHLAVALLVAPPAEIHPLPFRRVTGEEHRRMPARTPHQPPKNQQKIEGKFAEKREGNPIWS
jgi:hypothetical protein